MHNSILFASFFHHAGDSKRQAAREIQRDSQKLKRQLTNYPKQKKEEEEDAEEYIYR